MKMLVLVRSAAIAIIIKPQLITSMIVIVVPEQSH